MYLECDEGSPTLTFKGGEAQKCVYVSRCVKYLKLWCYVLNDDDLCQSCNRLVYHVYVLVNLMSHCKHTYICTSARYRFYKFMSKALNVV